MSLLKSLFNKGNGQDGPQGSDSSGLGDLDATVPMMPSLRTGKEPAAPDRSQEPKSHRQERREKLYTVVRDCMTRAGVLSSGYKFKVLSLDPRGMQYLIMMDLAPDYARDTARLGEIEVMIAQAAKARFEILVTALYWRINEQVTANLTRPAVPPNAPAKLPAAALAPTTPKAAPKFDPLAHDEVAAFKQALASGVAPSPAAAASSRRQESASPPPDFPDTEVVDPDERPLSGTQYGDLN